MGVESIGNHTTLNEPIFALVLLFTPLDLLGLAVDEDEVPLGVAVVVAHGRDHDIAVGEAVRRVRRGDVERRHLLRLDLLQNNKLQYK